MTLIERLRERGLWMLGQIIAVLIGFGVYLKYDWSAGIAVAYIISVLVDIREQTEAPNKAK